MAGVTYWAVSDAGDVRAENQDSVLCMIGEVQGKAAALFLVADGMGGLSYGASVSRYIKDQFLRWWREDFPSMVQAGRTDREDIKELLEQEIWDINQAVLRFKKDNDCRAGSTLSLLFLYGNEYYVENLGDSRIYRLRKGILEQITEDQSLVAQMVREKRMTKEEAMHSGKKNILTMCIGMFQVPQIFSLQGVQDGKEVYLLCSDGLYNAVSELDIRGILSQEMLSCRQKAEQLRQLISKGEALDNVSIIVAGQPAGTCKSRNLPAAGNTAGRKIQMEKAGGVNLNGRN